MTTITVSHGGTTVSSSTTSSYLVESGGTLEVTSGATVSGLITLEDTSAQLYVPGGGQVRRPGPGWTVAGATAWTLTVGENSIASSRTRWFTAALLVS